MPAWLGLSPRRPAPGPAEGTSRPDMACAELVAEGAGAVPDAYATIADLDVATQERLAGVLELRAADPQQRAILESYLSEIEFRPGARVLEVGCGTGAVTRALAGRPEVSEAVGLDPSPVFLATARELANDATNMTFEQGDGRSLPFAEADFDGRRVAHDAVPHSGAGTCADRSVSRRAPRGHSGRVRRRLRHGHSGPWGVGPSPRLHRGGQGRVPERCLARPPLAGAAAVYRVRGGELEKSRLPADR